ncbi:hypothetical protein Q0F98_29715 [Paenibacillus amylolyticus]|nr:hypothetical protein Q0F98_29715 [Paenibacillus amylolyticus]
MFRLQSVEVVASVTLFGIAGAIAGIITAVILPSGNISISKHADSKM